MMYFRRGGPWGVHQMTELLSAISILFIVAGPLMLIANRISLPTAPALIVAGIIAGTVIAEDLALEIARLGIALLVFTFAVRIDLKNVQDVASDSELIAFGQIGVIGILGFGAGIAVGLAPDQAIFLGIASALSSSIVGTTLFLPGEVDPAHDRLSESIHSIQDFCGLFLLLVFGAGVLAKDPIALQLGYGVILLLLAVGIHRYIYDLIGRVSGGSNESMLIGTIALLLLFLALAELMGISIVVGAFAAGIAVRHDFVKYYGVINGLESITDFFAAIFFLTVGTLVTIPSGPEFVMSMVLIFLAAIVKPAFTIALLIYRGFERRTATLTAFNLDQVSEFAIIIAIEAFILGMIVPSVFDAIILAAAVTLVTSSFTRYYEESIYHFLADRGLLGDHSKVVDRWSSVPEPLVDHIAIIGYGRHGRRLVDVCERNDIQYVVVENNPGYWQDMNRNCSAYVYGDVIEQDTADMANLQGARLIVSTPDSTTVNEHLMKYTEEVDVMVRIKQRSEAKRYLEQGATYVSVTDLLAADWLAERLEALLREDADLDTLREEFAGDGTVVYRTAQQLPKTGPGG